MKQEALISIIVPVYKAEKYLEKCVHSLLSQTYSRLEIILVDDGSPDSSPELCDRLAAKDDRIKVCHKPNGGVSSARNAGLDIATGDYVGFVDADDFVDERMFGILLQGFSIVGGEESTPAECGDILKREPPSPI